MTKYIKRLNRYSCILLIAIFSSCESYLDYYMGDQMTKDEVFSKRETTERYFSHVYSFLPSQSDEVISEMSAMGSMIALSDESYPSWTAWVHYLDYNSGSFNPSSPGYKIWNHCYKGIKQASIFMENIDDCEEISPENRAIMKEEARVIRAFLYFCLVRHYGPVYVWGDVNPDETDGTIINKNIDRHTLDYCFKFIHEEIDKAIPVLQTQFSDRSWFGRITRGAAMAMKSRSLLYAASPLFNGATLYKGMQNKDGENLFPQATDLNKWETAAQAAKAVIDLNIYQLHQSTKGDTDFDKAINSYMGIFFEQWNEEVILGRIWGTYDWVANSSPSVITKEGNSGYCPSLKLVDAYPMGQSGRYPITGYAANGVPVIDSKSGYVEDGFKENYVHPVDHSVIKAHNSVVGRDARFYASILWSGMNWINTFQGEKLVTFNRGGTSGFQNGTGSFTKVGYMWRRMNDPSNDTQSGNWGSFCWPYFRLAEVYLNYAEACNEKPNRNETDALLYFNKVRARSGLNKIEEAYPEVIGNKELFRELMRKERMVEFAFEGGGHRFYDVHRWMIAEKEFNGPRFGRDVSQTDFEKSWKRTSEICLPQVFTPKYYFFPIHQDQLNEMVNFTQNYGW